MKSKITNLMFAGAILVAGTTAVHAQKVNKYGDNSMTIAPTAVLELESTTKGFLSPRMTETQKNAIGTPATGLLVFQTDGLKGFYYWSGSSWEYSASSSNQVLNSGNLFVGNASNIATGVALSGDASITSAGALTIANDAVTTVKILNANVTTAKIADDNITTAKILNSNVTTAKIADDNITTAKILNLNVTTAKIADANVTLAKLSATGGTAGQVLATSGTALTWATPFTNTLSSANIFVGNGANIATGAALSGDATITNAGALSISANAVNSAKILNESILSEDIVNGTIAEADLATSAVTSLKIANETILSEDIFNGTIATVDVADNAVTYAKMQAMTGNKLLGSGLTGTAVAELTLGNGLSFTGATLNAVSNNVANVVAVAGNTTLTPANNTVYSSAAMTLTLPAASGNSGLTYLIKKTDNDTILTFDQDIYVTSATDKFTTLNYAKSLRIQSNGTNWYLID